jgi:transcriptional regulator NrdR family protein
MMEKIIKNTQKGVEFYDRFSDVSGNSISEKVNIQPSNYCNLVKKVKKDNITPDNIGEIILSQIPGVSSVTAIAIMSNFKSFYNLVESLQKNPSCLENLTITKNDKTRKISKKVLEDIKRFLLYIPQE